MTDTDTPADAEIAAIWRPGRRELEQSNLAGLCRTVGVADYDALLTLSRKDPETVWRATLAQLELPVDLKAGRFVDDTDGKPWTRFFPDATFNSAAAALEPPQDVTCPALIWEAESGDTIEWSYSELGDQVRAAAAGLRAKGAMPGDRIGILMPNIPEAVVAFLAITWIGGIAVPLYSGFGPEPARQRLEDAKASWLFVADGFSRRGRIISMRDVVAEITAHFGDRLKVVEVSVINQPLIGPGIISWSELSIKGGDAEYEVTKATDPSMILYTSGTTGKPKGIVHCHGGFALRLAQDVGYIFDFSASDRLFWMSDIGWMIGPLSIFAPLLLKGTLVLYDGAPDYPDGGRLRSVARRHSVTHFGSAPTAIRGMRQSGAVDHEPSLPSLKVLMTAGEAIDPDMFTWYFQTFGAGRCPVINYTGGTEVSGAILTNVVMRPIHPGTFNSTGLCMDVGILNDAGEKILREEGELSIFQPFVGMAQGFWGDPDRYIESYWARFPDVWVHGDLAVEHENGGFRLLGRSDDVMKIAGRRTGPSELEAVANQCAQVVETMVTSVPDPVTGESLIIFVQPVDGEVDTGTVSQAVSDAIVAKMGRPFRPKTVVSVDRLPKTRNGKPMRRLLRQAWLGLPSGNTSGMEDASVYFDLLKACKASLEP